MATLRQKIGQMLIMGFKGTKIDALNPVKTWLSTDGLGGVLLFDYDLAEQKQGKNLVDFAQISQLTHDLNAHNHSELPLFIGIDYEGGAVDRLKKIPASLPTLTAEELANLSELDLKIACDHMAKTLKSLGFTLNFAPVVDLNLTQDTGIIGKLHRSFSNNPEEVVRVAKQFVSTFKQQGITCCYKHFPGHGSASGDTHHGFVDVTDTFEPQELAPYYALLREDDSSMVMTAHVINRTLDKSGLPATLSHDILTKLLRKTIGYDGVIISDDLQMNAISHHYSTEEALKLTINAGADMLIFANQLGEISATSVIDIIEKLVQNKGISEARISEAFKRIARLKQSQMACA